MMRHVLEANKTLTNRVLSIAIFLIGLSTRVVSSYVCGDFFSLKVGFTSGTIDSPNYPSHYNNGLFCIWLIQAPSNYSVTLVIPEFDGETASDGSCKDYLEVRDGSSSSEQLLYTCGSNQQRMVVSTNRWLWFKFKTNNFVTNTGFSATYSIVYTGAVDAFSPISACQGVNFVCRNKECVYDGYRCDNANDCGCTGSGCDEAKCYGLNWSEAKSVTVGVTTGLAFFCALFLGIGFLEYYLRWASDQANIRMKEEDRKRKRRPRQRKKSAGKPKGLEGLVQQLPGSTFALGSSPPKTPNPPSSPNTITSVSPSPRAFPF